MTHVDNPGTTCQDVTVISIKWNRDTNRELRRHWTTSGGRDCEVVPRAEEPEREKRRDVMMMIDGVDDFPMLRNHELLQMGDPQSVSLCVSPSPRSQTSRKQFHNFNIFDELNAYKQNIFRLASLTDSLMFEGLDDVIAKLLWHECTLRPYFIQSTLVWARHWARTISTIHCRSTTFRSVPVLQNVKMNML